MPLAEAYAQWLRELWQTEVQGAKASAAFLRDPDFHRKSRDFCVSTFNRLKEEYKNAGVLKLKENIHMIIVGMTAEDEPFFIAIDHGGPNIFDHTFVSSDLGEFPHVYPMEAVNILDWVKDGLGTIQQTQATIRDRAEFAKRVQNISAQVFKEISILTDDVSSACDCVVITASSSSLRRCDANARSLNTAHVPAKQSALKVGRNDPCPCGSGLKYKKCHGR